MTSTLNILKSAARSMKITAFITICLVFVATNSGASSDSPTKPHPDYPGWSKTGGSGWNIVAMTQAYAALQAYYRIYGQWPESWATVKSANLFQAHMPGYQLEVIDPDDGSLDFPGDLVYTYLPSSNTAKISYMVGFQSPGQNISQRDVQPPGLTYAELFEAIDNSRGSTTSDYLEDESWLQTFGILAQCMTAIGQHRDVYGEVPSTWAQLMDSGLAPVNRHSINPVTGASFLGDGDPGDILYRVDGENYHLVHIHEDGELPEVRFSY